MKLKDGQNYMSDYELKSNIELFTDIINKVINLYHKIQNKENIDKTIDEIKHNLKKNIAYIKYYMVQMEIILL